jgi:hypothetical protein
MGVWNSHAVGLYMTHNYVASNIMFQDFSSYGADISIVKHTNPETNTVWGPFGDNVRANVKDQRNFDCATGEPAPDAPTITVADSAEFVHISWSNVEHEAGYKVQRKRANSSEWTTIAYRPRQETGGVVIFGFGPRIDGYIALNDGYPAAPFNRNTWDGRTRNMNPPVWRDYTKMAGEFDYRVIAIACEDDETAASDPIRVTVTIPVSNSTALNNLSEEVVLYPVPAQKVLFAKSSQLKGQRLQVLDNAGKILVDMLEVSDNAIRVPIDHLQPGLYNLRTKAIGQAARVKKFVVQ